MKSPFFYLFAITISIVVFIPKAEGKRPLEKEGYFELKVYHYSNGTQENIINNFIKNDLFAYLHNCGIKNIGVFTAIANDTAIDKRIYVLIPFNSLKQWNKYSTRNANDPPINSSSKYTNAVNDSPAYSRIETIFLRGFKRMPYVSLPKLKTPINERVYELRSYESASEKLHVNKVHMFNEGGEIEIFSRLGFNAVFYASVIHGAKMPNLMYMTSFDNIKAREEHWSEFSKDAAWKELSAKKEYQKNVSKSEITFLRPTSYSEL
jgi:hypothetical protein